MKTNEEFIQEENLQFYAANVAAWFNTRLEYDKSLLVLSTGGVALLLTLFTSLGASSITVLVLYALAAISFLGAAVSLLFVFKLNSRHIEEVLQQAHSDASAESDSPDSAKAEALTSKVLQLLDWSVIVFFGVGPSFKTQ
ncbi:hypothetical protein [Caballeronia sordidicola]|uniref:hypothetical protein n=1 Tax=Caballeronia sordidicola TaxID=196367 RepID=UPI0004D011B3|nr:hypothetical protein [Caballeronia sordidicola]